MIPPDSIVEALRLFPGLGIGLAVAWYAARVFERSHGAEISRLQEEHAQHLATKDAMLARLDAEVALLRKERDRWFREANSKDKP